MNAEKVVIQCIKKIAIVKKDITMETSLIFDLQMDSMLLVTLGMLLEEKVGISIVVFSENIDFVSDVKVKQIVELVEKNT